MNGQGLLTRQLPIKNLKQAGKSTTIQRYASCFNERIGTDQCEIKKGILVLTIARLRYERWC